ncbi:GAF and ANTAR domain-containing protein [Terrabacter sp. BE26]|uniref:GAF and ANTAR domain-containing protein n=1 Tax=Terrabacter sp. BE26 TaxID=2898152 RepID=UPI0035BE6232
MPSPQDEREPSDAASGGGTGSRGPSPEIGTPAGFASLARDLFELQGVMPTLRAVVTRALDVVPCQWAAAAMTDHLTKHPAPLAAMTDSSLMQRVASISAEAGDSPGIEAFNTGAVTACPDLASPELPERWATYARELLRRTDIRSVLSLPLLRQGKTVGVMTVYADTADAFGAAATGRARVLAEHAAIVIEAARADDRAEHLEVALVRSRIIGAAMGVLIERLRIGPDEAFALLRQLSQNSNRKLADIAAELVETGTVPGLDARGRGCAGDAVT